MRKNRFKVIILLITFIAVSFVVYSQDIPLKVTDGILYTVDGNWGDGILLQHSKTKYGINYRANLNIASGEHTLEYYFMEDEKVYKITFMAQADKKYFVCEEANKLVVKEDKNILNSVKIVNVSSKSGENGFQIVPGITDKSEVATLIWDYENDYFPKYKRPIFILKKVDSYWGDGSTGYTSGRYNEISKDAFKVKLPSGEHTLSARLEFGNYHLLSIQELKFNFEAGKTYTVEFKDFGVDTKKSISELHIKLILGSVKIVELKD